MAYPGNPELSAEAQDRVLTAFGQVVSNLQQGQREEAMIGLDFVLRLDQTFAPAVYLKQQLASGTEIDLAGVLGQLQATTPEMIDNLLVEAVDDFNQREFQAAKTKVDQVLRELPGHQEARQLQAQIEEALKVQEQVAQLVNQAQEALTGGDPQEAANFVMMAQALDPHNQAIQDALGQIQSVVAEQGSAGAGAAAAPPQPTGFETSRFEVPAQPANAGFGFDAQPADAGLGFDAQPADAGLDFDAQPEQPAGAGFSFDAQPEQPAGAGFSFDAQPEQPADAGFGFEPQPDQAADVGFGFDAQPVQGADAGFGFDAQPAQGADVGFGFDAQPAQGADAGFGFDAQPDQAADAGFGFDAQPARGADAGFGFDAQPDQGADAGFGMAAPAGGDLFGDSSAGNAGLFSAPDAADFAPPAAPDSAIGQDDDSRVRELIGRGEAAFSRGSLDEAIDAWSQVFLIDPTHAEASRLIEEARLARDDLERVLDASLNEARAAAASGNVQRALSLTDEILAQRPTHIAAYELKESLSEGAPPVGAEQIPLEAPALPDLAEDLFQEELPAVDELAPLDGAIDETEVPTTKPRRAARGKPIPMKMLIAVFGGVVIILVGVMAGLKLISFGSSDNVPDDVSALNQVLEEAEQKANQGRLDEAIRLLQEYPASELEASRISKRIEKYEGMLHPTPTPIPAALTEAEPLLARGLLLDAYTKVEEGLEQNPRDVGLRDLKERIINQEPLVANLYRAVKANNHRTVVSIAQELLDVHPDKPDFTAVLERSLFNAALEELKEYNLTGAEVHLVTLVQRRPDDLEARRVLEFINTYKARPVDMRLRVFIGNLSPR